MADDGDDETTSDPDRGSAKMPGLRARPRPDQRPQAQAVVSSACRYKQAEITPANRFVVAKSSSRQAEVRFDYRRRVWHILHQHHLPATAEVDATASRDHCRWEEGRTSPTCSDSHGGGVPLDKTTGCDDGTGSDSAPPWRKDGEDVINSATCGSSTRQRNVERNEGATEPFPCEANEGDRAVGIPIVTPKETPPCAGQDAERVLDKKRSAAGSERGEEQGHPHDESSGAASQQGSAREAHDDGDGGEGGARGEGRCSGAGDGHGGQEQIGEEPTQVPASSARAMQSPSQNRTELRQPKTAGTASTEGSTDPPETSARESRPTTQATWRGQPVALAGPIVITLTESSLRELQCGRRRRRRRRGHHKPGTDDTRSPAEDSDNEPTSSDGGSDARHAPAAGRKLFKSAQRKGARERDGDRKRRGPTESGSSMRVAFSRRNNTRASPPSDAEAKEEHLADRKNSSRYRRREEALPLDSAGSFAPTPRGSRGQGSSGALTLARPAVFLLEPYAGPPTAACSRAWPAGTRVMAAPTKGCRRRNRRVRRESGAELYSSRRARRMPRRAGGETRLGSSCSSSSEGTTTGGSCSDTDTLAREDKGGDGPRAESKEVYR